MLHQQLLGEVTQPSSSNTRQSVGNKQTSFIDQLRFCLQRPKLSEKCRDLTNLLLCGLSAHNQKDTGYVY